MSTTVSNPSVSRQLRMCVALTVAGWLTILALALSAGISSDPVQAPAMDDSGTPVKAYPG